MYILIYLYRYTYIYISLSASPCHGGATPVGAYVNPRVTVTVRVNHNSFTRRIDQ